MEPEVQDSEPHTDGTAAADWESRRLCVDGNCIGVIGPDGRCRECGRRYEATEAGEEPAAEAHSDVAPAVAQPLTPPLADPAAGAADDWETRRLCSDGNCIGVIGSDGRCRECGKPYAG